jgi:uncharacterized membrane protein HdeD (DUF308 family)
MFSEVPQIARNWWMFALLGVICVVTGIAAIVWPDITLLALGIIFGIYLLIAAIIEIIDAIFGPPGGRAISAILGIVALIAGVICIRRPGESLLAIVIVAGIFLVAEGVIRIVRAFASTGARWWGIAIGAVDAIVGIVILAWPGIGLVTLAVFFAITMLTRGIFAIVIGIRLRSVRNAPEEPSVQTATYAT